MILSDKDIKALSQPHYNRPLIEDIDLKRLQGASYDVHLSNKILLESNVVKPWEENPEGLVLTAKGIKPIWVECDITDGIYLTPGAFFLSKIDTRVNLPLDVAAELRLTSSRGREGWDHALAVWIDPGYSGEPTVEVKNSLRFNLIFVDPHKPCFQIIFHKLTSSAHRDYAQRGRYNNANTIETSKG